MTRIGTVSIEELRVAVHAKVDKEAADLRKRFITLDDGMDLVYAEKRRESEAFMADTNISEAETPHLTKEAARFNITRYEMAWTIITSAYQWANVSATIEELRTWHKGLANSASTPREVREAGQVDWSPVLSYL